MSGRDKLKLNKKDILVFVIPFIILSLLIGLVGYSNAIRRIDDINSIVENSTIDIANSYAKVLTNTQEMESIVEGLMEDKLLLVGEAISLLNKEDISSDELNDLSNRFQVWRINILSDRGEIIASNDEGNIGWEAYDGHPAHNFLLSDEKYLIEDIRMGSINDVYLKFGYIRRENKTFIQIGMEANEFHRFSRNFQAKKVIDSIMGREEILHISLVDMDGRIVASSMNITPGILIDSKDILNHLEDEEAGIIRHDIKGKGVLQGYAPVFIDNNRVGSLSVGWNTAMTDTAINEIILYTVVELAIIIIIIGCILYYAFKKNKHNIKIAYYDKLTGQANKEYLEEYLDEFTSNMEDVNKAMFFINLTNFKLVNLTYGYNYGDKILIKVSKEITKLLNQKEMLFRLNGDRFVLLKEEYESIDELKGLAEEIIMISKDLVGENHRLEYVNLEIGIIELDKYNLTLDKMSKDMALALSNSGSSEGNIVFYNEDIEKRGERQNKIETILEEIIEGKDTESFYLKFQPKLDLKTNKIIGFEALARLNHKDLGQVPPLEFIELAEDRMLIYDLGKIIFRKSCEFLKKLNDKGFKNTNVSINISAMQILREGFISDIKKTVDELDVDMNNIELEITESILIENIDLINGRLKEIRNLGMSVSIDDFGTGFSSFARLKILPVDILKIDKYFIDSILLEDENNLISMDIISMAHRLGLTVVAEGVEEKSQREYLEKYNCDIIQGYLISRPLREIEAIKLL